MNNDIWNNLFPSSDISTLIFMLFVFFISGIVKGFLGIGLPAAAMALLTLVIPPAHAISLLVIPILFTNLTQFSRAKHRMEAVKTYWLFAIAIIISIFLTSLFLSKYPTGLLTISIGFAMIIVSLNGLIGVTVKMSDSRIWQLGFGVLSGVLGGLSSIWSPTVAIYLIARRVDKDRFISATGFLFLAGAVPLIFGLIFGGVLTKEAAMQSIFGLVFVLAGFRVGEILRNKTTQSWFEKAVLIAFLFMGVRLVGVGLF